MRSSALTRGRIFFHQTVIGVPQLATQRLIVRRPEPGRVFAFGFSGVFTATATGTFLLRRNQKRPDVTIINALPETDLFFRIQLTPVLRIVLFSHTFPRLCCTEGVNDTETGIEVF
jgi:hypothetical protein